MTSTNLEDLPQLVMDKITSFLNHKHLLALEQVSRKLKNAVDAHFSITKHLIIGSLPQIQTDLINYDEATVVEKKCLNGFLHIIKRCGSRLKTIQVTPAYSFSSANILDWNHSIYFNHFFESAEVSEKCPNLENVIVFPHMDLSFLYTNWFQICKGETCKLRSIIINNPETEYYTEYTEDIEGFLEHHSNLEQLVVYDGHENLLKVLPKLIENGLKDLRIVHRINFENLKKFCNVGKDLRTLLFWVVVSSNDDIAAINELHVPKNVDLQLKMRIDPADHLFAQLNEDIYNSVIFCEINLFNDYSLMTKLKNLQECWIRKSEQLKVMAEGSFPKLKRILDTNTLCDHTSTCDEGTCNLQIFLRQILINKGNQLTFIRITCNYCILIDVVWKALKYCTAAKIIEFGRLVINSPLSITAEDVKVVCDLPNLQHYMFSIDQTPDEDDHLFSIHPTRREDENCSHLRELMERVVKEHKHFKFEHKYEDDIFDCLQWFSLYKVDF